MLEKAHKHLAHKQFLGHPGHRSSRPGTRFLPAGHPDENVCVPWVPHTAHKLLTPGHRSTGRENPPPHPVGRPPSARAVTGKICLCLCAFSVPENLHDGAWGTPLADPLSNNSWKNWLRHHHAVQKKRQQCWPRHSAKWWLTTKPHGGFCTWLQNLWKSLKTSESLWKSLKTSENLWRPLQEKPPGGGGRNFPEVWAKPLRREKHFWKPNNEPHVDPDVADWVGAWALTLSTSCCRITARCLRESQDIMASPVPLPDLERHQRTHKSKQHGSHLCNLVNGTHGDLGEGRTEVGSGGSKTSEFLLVVKHPLRHTQEPLLT